MTFKKNVSKHYALASSPEEAFKAWVLDYVHHLADVAAYLRSVVDDFQQVSAAPVDLTLLANTIKERFTEFETEEARLYADFISLKRKWPNILPADLLEARDLAFAAYRNKVNIAVTGVSLAATEFKTLPVFDGIPPKVKVRIEYYSELTLEQQISEFEDVFNTEQP